MNDHSESSHDNYDISQENKPQSSSSSSTASSSSESSPSFNLVNSVQNDQFKHLNRKQHSQLSQNHTNIEASTSHDTFTPDIASDGRQNSDQNNQPILDDAQSSLLPRDFHQLAQDKEAVYKHPLFPLLAILLEKCEYATATLGRQTGPPITTINSTVNSDDESSDSPPSSPADEANQSKASVIASSQHSFNHQVQSLLDLHLKQGKPLLVDNDEVDTLMIKAIQVLRINLVELEKVQELCKDFCQRYITCLREKMSSENLLRGTTGFGSSGHAAFSFEASSRSSSPSSDEDSVPPAHSHHSNNYRRMSGLRNAYESYTSGKQSLSPCESGQQVDSMNQQQQQQHHHMSFDVNDVQRDSGNEGDLSDDAATAAFHGSDGKNSKNGSNGSSSSCKQKCTSKRGILPKQATSIMRSWLFQHIVHPYPTEDEKRAISAQTNLTLLQVNNWFINARRRILQPMLDSANTVGNSENNCNNSSNTNANSSTNGSHSASNANNNNNNNNNNHTSKLSVDLTASLSTEVVSKKLRSTGQVKKSSNSSVPAWTLESSISPRSSLSGQ